jgi:hypothetical protein
VKVRLLVVFAFLGMAAVPIVLAWNSGIVPGPQSASAGSTGASITSSAVATTLVWPADPLGLAALDGKVVWEQRDPSAEVAGLWYYDVASGQKQRLFGRRTLGRSSGFPAAAGDLIVWSSWARRRGDGPAAVQAYNSAATHRWEVGASGRDPSASGDLVLWVEPDGAGAGNDVIRAVNKLTDEELSVTPGGRVRDYGAWGRWAAWISGLGSDREVWAGPFLSTRRHRLAAKGTAVAIDRDRIVWAAAVGRHSTAIVSWGRRTGRSKVLCRVTGSASQLSLAPACAVWVTTRKATGPKVWAYDFKLGKAFAVSDSGGRQVSPVLVGGTVYWAGDRGGRWELFSRSLQH